MSPVGIQHLLQKSHEDFQRDVQVVLNGTEILDVFCYVFSNVII